ncbi:hypothetical protein K493DRAFT_303922 [Basidiobolus meristosporus CBS 931.73]|uniref:Uncharacterized protein n=1 Tax=Basidiobolus meristosporus CBS 931.73 TaxID=1314790 RepID=A0A1Y1Y0R4_9FUNG|nr:hypothetical protein K493DRAFT_303922 [Basidiobolus meristosporus CBS 931.73]|eukprot:ORX91597.1 hypothetical protein K493DRAFT_303922 [Basidiobolus meristosporus CBS 931.73]
MLALCSPPIKIDNTDKVYYCMCLLSLSCKCIQSFTPSNHHLKMKYSIAKLLLVVSAALAINATVLERSYDPNYKGVGHGGGDDYDADYDGNSHGRRKKYGDDYDDDYDGNGGGRRRRYDGDDYEDDYDGHGHGRRKKHGNDYDDDYDGNGHGRKKHVGGGGRSEDYDDY